MPEAWKTIRENWFPLLLSTALVIFIFLLPRQTDNSKPWFYSVCLIGLAHLAYHFRKFDQFEPRLKIFFVFVALFFLWSLFSFYFNDQPGNGRSILWNRHFHLLMIVPLCFLFARIRISFDILLIAFSLTSLIAILEILRAIYLGTHYLNQGINPNAYGPILLGYAGFLLFSFLYNPDRWRRGLALAGFMLAMAAVILSKSKGTWLAIPVLTVFFVFYLPYTWSRLKKIYLLITLIALIVSSYLLPPVGSRIDLAIDNLTQYFATDDLQDPSRTSAAGTRLELWKSAWKIFLENPVTGAGPGGFKSSSNKNAEGFGVNEVVKRFEHPHNQYLNALATRGIPGLILLLGLLLLPIMIAFKTRSLDREVGMAGATLIFICITYLIGNLVDDHLENKPTIIFFVLMLGLLLGRINLFHGDSTVQNE